MVTVTCRGLQLEELGLTPLVPPGTRLSGDLLPKLKRFRYEILADFITDQFKPCRVADVGCDKVLLAWLLLELWLAATVIDPQPQAMPEEYKSLSLGRRLTCWLGCTGMDRTSACLKRPRDPAAPR